MNNSYNPNQSSGSSSQSSQGYSQSFPQGQGQAQSYGQSQGQSLAYNQVQAQQVAQPQAYSQAQAQQQYQQQLQAQQAARVQAQAVQQPVYSQSSGQGQVASSQPVPAVQQVVSAQQVAQATQPQQAYSQQPASQFMTPEELQKTQVLNLDDVKATARIEKISSKKPAALLASFGVLLLVVGFFFPTIQSLAAKHEREVNEPEYREEVDDEEDVVATPVKETLNCTLSKLNNANGTDELLSVTYNFEDNEIKTYSKEYTLRQSEGVTETPTELASYLEALEPFLAKQVPGYVMTLQQIANGSITKTTVNYSELDYNSIPAENQSNYRFDVPFQSNTTSSDVRSGLVSQGYTCE
ncbi:MAG: hypothetical protein IJG68_02990 [Bacilli bacterium]|nr:hypothetical protein [Bacilli bacterium]